MTARIVFLSGSTCRRVRDPAGNKQHVWIKLLYLISLRLDFSKNTEMMLPTWPKINIFQEQKSELNSRINRALSRIEITLLVFNLGLVFIYWLNWRKGNPGFPDLSTYLDAARGDFHGFYYAYWILPLFDLLKLLPTDIAIIIWSVLNLGGVFFATRIFGNHTGIVLSTYQLFYILFYGQVIGLIVGGIAVLWWGLKSRRWQVAGAGILLASTKFHVGIPTSLFLIFLCGVDIKSLTKIFIIPGFVFLTSLLLYSAWPMLIVKNLGASPPNTLGNISLWQWVGPAVLFLWIPVIWIPADKQDKLIWMVATLGLTLPYFQQTDLLTLFVHPVGLVAWLGNLGFLFIFKEWMVFKWLAVIPLIVYLLIFSKNIHTLKSA